MLSWRKLPSSIWRISSVWLCALASAARTRLINMSKAARPPRLKGRALMADCMAAISRRSASADSSAITDFRIRACTARKAPSLMVQPSKSATSTSTRSIIIRVLALLLPRRPRSSSSCSDCPRRRSLRRRPADWRNCSTTPTADCTSSCWRRGSSCATSASSSGGRRLAASRFGSRSTLAAKASRADSGKTRSIGTPRVAAVFLRCASICARTSATDSSGSASVSILLSTTNRSRLA